MDILQPMRVLAVTEGAELSTKDVDPRWLMDRAGELPDPERALSRANLWLGTDIPAGNTTADFTVPTVTDQLAGKPSRYASR